MTDPTIVAQMCILLAASDVFLTDETAMIRLLTDARFTAVEIWYNLDHAIERAKEIRKARQP